MATFEFCSYEMYVWGESRLILLATAPHLQTCNKKFPVSNSAPFDFLSIAFFLYLKGQTSSYRDV